MIEEQESVTQDTPSGKATTKRQYKKVRRRVMVEEDREVIKDPKQYELITFRFWNEEQRGVPVDYSWIDAHTKQGQIKGKFYDGQTYTLPRVAFEYYRDMCSMPKYAQVDQELYPGMMTKAPKEVGRTHRFRMDVIAA